jgi:GR25 family glycosyltransferase involved in LPS biosynthesis
MNECFGPRPLVCIFEEDISLGFSFDESVEALSSSLATRRILYSY